MTNQPPTDRAFVREDNSTTLVCPKCRTAKDISVQQFRDKQHHVNVRCKCGYSFKVQLEFRRHFRKATSLSSTYKVKPPTGSGIATVVNLSVSGACFEVRGHHDFKIGQKGELVFTLDDKKKTVLFKNVIIRSINNNRIGCEFVDDRAFSKELGFYLRM